ncbi:hypothetical protein [Segetibacter koreensis]|uniref:hypothetical protein n=1 Tax=Segetibacter koreensis TaxID=398037 RepID=UPI0003606010|nr:hypothetical protein [Segetibacter koreensis]
MKQLFSIISIVIISACNGGDKIKDFIAGTYVADYEQEYSKGHDTLIFSPVSKEGNSYLITRKTSYRRKIKGVIKPSEQRNEQMTGIYNEQDKVIYETRKGETFSFSPEKNIVLSGTLQYKKIY